MPRSKQLFAIDVRLVARIAALAVVYVVIARAGLMMDAVGGFATLVWPPTGIALVALIRFGPTIAPGVAIGAFAVNAWTGAPIGSAIGMGIGNTLEALVGMYLLQRAGFRPMMDRRRDVLALVAAALVSPIASATFGVASLRLGGVITTDALVGAWRAWWLGDVMGALVVAPVLFAILSPLKRTSARKAEAAALLAMLVVTSFVAFGGVDIAVLRQPYVVFPVLIWAALRFGAQGAATAVFVVSAIAIANTARGYGEFAGTSLAESLFALQTFMAIVAVTLLILGAVSDERDEAIAKRQQFLEVVSHELKNPLGSIQLSADTLLARLSPGTENAAVIKRVQVIQRSADRMHSLVQNLLDVGAIEAGRLAVKVLAENARTIVDEAVDCVAAQAAAKQQTIERTLPESPLGVTCDRDRIVQVLVNLVGNAIKFSPAGSTIRVTLRSEPSRARFSVEDEGPGMTPDETGHAFERYWQAKQDTSKGRGLGLYISKGLVDAHRGELWVESRPGGGTAFHFTLPTSAS